KAWRHAGNCSSVKHLECIEKTGWRWAADRQQRRLLLLRAVCYIRIECDGQQRVVIEQTDGATNHGLRIAPHVPGEAQPRSKIILIARKTLLHIERVLCDLHVLGGQRDTGERIAEGGRCECVGQFNVVPDAIVQGEILVNLPRVLRKERNGTVLQSAVGVAESLNKYTGKTKAVSLYRRERWTPIGRGNRRRIAGNTAD